MRDLKGLTRIQSIENSNLIFEQTREGASGDSSINHWSDSRFNLFVLKQKYNLTSNKCFKQTWLDNLSWS